MYVAVTTNTSLSEVVSLSFEQIVAFASESAYYLHLTNPLIEKQDRPIKSAAEARRLFGA